MNILWCGFQKKSSKTIIPKNWAGFLHNSDNKEELFTFLSERIPQSNIKPEKQLYSINKSHVLTSHHSEDEGKAGIDPCNQEEADNRRILHTRHTSQQGHAKVLLQTVDTDVVVIAISQFQILGVSELWIAFGVAKQFRWIPVHSIAMHLGPDKSTGLLFMPAVTGCNTVSALARQGIRRMGHLVSFSRSDNNI